MKKYCPFLCRIQQVNEHSVEYDGDGKETAHIHKLVEVQEPAACKGKACGCYFLGRCRRKG